MLDLDLRRTGEQAEETMGPHPGSVQPVGDGPRLTLGARATLVGSTWSTSGTGVDGGTLIFDTDP